MSIGRACGRAYGQIRRLLNEQTQTQAQAQAQEQLRLKIDDMFLFRVPAVLRQACASLTSTFSLSSAADSGSGSGSDSKVAWDRAVTEVLITLADLIDPSLQHMGAEGAADAALLVFSQDLQDIPESIIAAHTLTLAQRQQQR